MIYCTSCKHHVRHSTDGMVWCKNPKNGIDLSDGSAKPLFANLNRNSETGCGVSANWFEVKEEQEPKPTTWWEMFWSKMK